MTESRSPAVFSANAVQGPEKYFVFFRDFVINRRSNELCRGEKPHPAVVALPDRPLIPQR